VEALRRTALIERFKKTLLVSSDWEPHVSMQQYGVFASKWPGKRSTLWTIVNRNSYPADGRQLTIAHTEGMRYYDFWNGTELKAVREDRRDTLTFPLEANGFGAVLATPSTSGEPDALLHKIGHSALNR
jgi:hypothetical protein